MAKVTFNIPKTGAVIKCRNKREIDMVAHFFIGLDIAASIFADNNDVEALYRRTAKLGGNLDAMLWLGLMTMDDATTAIVELPRVCREMAADGVKAYDTEMRRVYC